MDGVLGFTLKNGVKISRKRSPSWSKITPWFDFLKASFEYICIFFNVDIILLRYKQHSALKACFLSYSTPLDLPVSSDMSRFHNPELRFGSDQDHENQTVLKRCVGLQGNRGGKANQWLHWPLLEPVCVYICSFCCNIFRGIFLTMEKYIEQFFGIAWVSYSFLL